MMLYTYRARNEKGELIKGKIEGENTVEVARELVDIGYVPVDIRKSRMASSRPIFSKGKRVKLDELILFTRQFHTIIRTGVPLVRGLQTLRDQAESDRMRGVISKLLEDIQEGRSLCDAMKKHPAVFSSIYCNTVKAGETSGRLEEMFERLAELIEFELKVKEEIKSATRYPIMVIVVMALAFFVLVTFVVPKFTTMFSRFDMELPLPTKILIGINAYIRGYWHVNIILIAGIIFGVRYLLRTEWGIRKWDQAKLKIPVIGSITFKGIMSRFSRIFATLIGSGVPILEAIDIVSAAIGNTIIDDRLSRIRKQVMEGTGMSTPMKREGGFPPLLVQMISIGEETGAMEEMLLEVSRHYETEIEYQLRRLSTAIEPILIIGLGAVMLLLALGVFMPLWNMVGIVRH